MVLRSISSAQRDRWFTIALSTLISNKPKRRWSPRFQFELSYKKWFQQKSTSPSIAKQFHHPFKKYCIVVLREQIIYWMMAVCGIYEKVPKKMVTVFLFSSLLTSYFPHTAPIPTVGNNGQTRRGRQIRLPAKFQTVLNLYGNVVVVDV